MKRNFRPKLLREQILALAAAVLLGVMSELSGSSDDTVLKEGYGLKRSEPGGADLTYELKVGGLSDSEEVLSVKVSPREYTEEEAYIKLDALMEELAVHMIGNNRNMDSIDTDLNFPKSIPGYDGIKLSYYPEHPDLIDYDGKVNNLSLTEPSETSIRINLKTGSYQREYCVPVVVYPATAVSENELRQLTDELIASADKDQINNEYLTLPDNVNGLSLSYHTEQEHTAPKIILGGILVAVLLGLRPEQEKQRRQKQRETELLSDYSDIVSKLMVYTGAGLTVRNAWMRIADGYRASVEKRGAPKRAAYEEILMIQTDLQKGVPEPRAYAEFGRRCAMKCYMKLASILEQNIKNGDSRSEEALRFEMQDAFEQRKNLAKRQGEEAGTKLMLPLMMSLSAVLIIAAAPAVLTML